MLVTHSRTCYQLDGILIKEGTSTYWHHVQGENLSSCKKKKNGQRGREGASEGGGDQAMCQHLQIWPPFVPWLLSSLSSSHLRNHVMIIRWKPIKKSNKREYIIIEAPGPDDSHLCVCVRDREGRRVQLLLAEDKKSLFVYGMKSLWSHLLSTSGRKRVRVWSLDHRHPFILSLLWLIIQTFYRNPSHLYAVSGIKCNNPKYFLWVCGLSTLFSHLLYD